MCPVMLPHVSEYRVLRFGAFEADLQVRELRKQGMQMELQEQPFQILEFLLEHPGEIVTREQLRQKLWAADTSVDYPPSDLGSRHRNRACVSLIRSLPSVSIFAARG